MIIATESCWMPMKMHWALLWTRTCPMAQHPASYMAVSSHFPPTPSQRLHCLVARYKELCLERYPCPYQRELKANYAAYRGVDKNQVKSCDLVSNSFCIKKIPALTSARLSCHLYFTYVQSLSPCLLVFEPGVCRSG
jgi:hypothetical protein